MELREVQNSLLAGKGVVVRFVAAALVFSTGWLLTQSSGFKIWWAYGALTHFAVAGCVVARKGHALIGKDPISGQLPWWSWYLTPELIACY